MFEVQTYSLCDGWSNTWTTWSDTEDEHVETFKSKKEAENAILDEIKDTRDAIERGDMDEGAALSMGDFKIVKIN
jgi:hypothetical protein